MTAAKATEASNKKTAGATKVCPEAFSAPKNKEEFYNQLVTRLNNLVEAKRGHGRKVFGNSHGRDIVVLVFDGLADILTHPNGEGTVVPNNLGMPGGWGSIQLGTAKATTKRTPQGKVVEVPKRWRVVWKPGKAMSDRIRMLEGPPQPVALQRGSPSCSPTWT
jgi:hypothetical protein